MPIFIDVFHEFYGTAIVPTFIDTEPFLINIVPTYNFFLIIMHALIVFYGGSIVRMTNHKPQYKLCKTNFGRN